MLGNYDADSAYSLLWPEAIAALYTTDTIKAGWLSVCFHIKLQQVYSDGLTTISLYRSPLVLVLSWAKSLLVS